MTVPDPLASLLVREGVLPPQRVEEANERMVLLGGRLDTALLELGLLDEATLLPLLARAYGAPPVTRADVLKMDRALAQVFPRRLSEKHGVVPLEVSGRRLSVAIAGPPDLTLLDEIGFMLSVYVKACVMPEVRLAWARARLYATDMPARLNALLASLGENDLALKPNETWSAHSTAEKPRVPSTGAAYAVSPAADVSGWTVASHAGLARGAPSAPAIAHASGGSVAAAAEAKAQRDKPVSYEEKRRKERVLWTVDDAIAELALADERDQMLDVVLRFAYRRLSTVAIFILHASPAAGGQRRTELIGWDIIDPLLGKNDIGAIPIPAAGDHALAQVVSMQSPFLGPLKEGDPLARLFGRRPRACLLVPILVDDRIIGVLYGDAGTRSVSPSSLAELHMVVPRLGKGLKNLILRKKKILRAASEAAAAAGKEREEREESIAVSPVQRTNRPTLDIDIVEIEEAEAAYHLGPSAARDAAPAALEAPAGLSTDPVGATAMPWADGAPDDEDVRLDESAFADLAAAPRKVTSRLRLEMPGLEAPEPAPSAWADGGDDDEDVRLDGASLAALSASDAPPREAARLDLGSLDEELAAAPAQAVQAPQTTADSPGASARESLLLATWHDWLKHEDDELDQLVGELQLKKDGSRDARQALSLLVGHGARAMPSLARWFPGALTVHPFGTMPRRPEVEELSDCTSCLVKLGVDLAAPILVGELGHDDRLHRWAAVWTLSRLKAPGGLMRLAQRIFDPEPAIGALAIEVLDGYRTADGFPKVLAHLRDLLKRGDAFERARAIDAVTELRDRGALSALIDLLGTKPKELADAARNALTEITKQDFGNAERRWRAWIADNDAHPRMRWLIDGLAHKDEAIRRSAQAELNRLTGQYFGYRYDAARTEREQGLAAWQDWWSTQEREAPGRWT